MAMLLTAARLWDGHRVVDCPLIRIEDGLIVSIDRAEQGDQHLQSADVFHLPSATLAPAFFDVHIHGAAGHDVMEATPEALGAMGRFLASHGTASYLATTVTAALDTTLHAVSGLAKLIQRPGFIAGNDAPTARPIGIHLEGPFLSGKRCGVQPKEHLLEPSVSIFDRLYEAAEGQIRLMTLAPELPGAIELVRHAVARGVRVSLGHSDANAAETLAAVAAGATSATHVFNAMRPLSHREPGILGVTLTTDALYTELICDGIHTAPEIVRLWYRAKGPERTILVTDAISATGMSDGEYTLGGFQVNLANGRTMARGVLAGSVLTLDRALTNLLEFTGASLCDALRLLTTNPAAMTGLESSAGSVDVGKPANLVAVDGQGKLLLSIVNGKLATADEQTRIGSRN
jgi:N-acetylglucosamine-6-phosphate deacetylase